MDTIQFLIASNEDFDINWSNEIFHNTPAEVRQVTSHDIFRKALEEMVPDLLFIDEPFLSEKGIRFLEQSDAFPKPVVAIAGLNPDSRDRRKDLLQKGVYSTLIRPFETDEIACVMEKAFDYFQLKQERNRLEAELKQYRDPDESPENPLAPAYLFEVLMNYIPEVVYFKDRKSRFLHISRAGAKKHGLDDPEEAKGKTDFDFFSKEHARKAYEDEKKIIETGEPIVGKEEKETWPDGRDTWASTTKAPLIDPGGNIQGTFGISRDITRRKNAERELQEYVEAMENDLERARAVQDAMLPSEPPSHDHLDIAFRFLPYEQVSGDYLSMLRLDGKRLGIFVGDVSGHGVSAALFMALIKFLTERFATDFGDQPPVFLNKLNQELLDLEGHPSKFLTGIYGYLEPRPEESVCEVTLAKGGHPDPVLVQSGEDSVTRVPLNSNGAMGIISQFEPEPETIVCEPGDRLFLYTDGLSEVRKQKGHVQDTEAFLRLIDQAQQPDLSQTMDDILEEGKEKGRAEGFDDDVVLCGIEMKSSS